MPNRITKSFTFDSAHWLPNVPPGHKCGHMHGHTYTVTIGVEGDVDPRTGWIVDFGDIKAAFKPLEKIMDHRVLNEIEGLENPTAENMARWICMRLQETLPGVTDVTVKETPTSAAVYRRDD